MRQREPRVVLTFVGLWLAVSVAAAQGRMEGKEPSELFPWGRFDPAIPTQEAVVGVAPGVRPLRHAELLRYFEALAEASPRARLADYALSHEGRRLVYLAISDEATLSGLDAFRSEHARRVDPRDRSVEQDAAAIAGAKAVAWMAYSIHGDELSSSDAAAALAYWLVAGRDERADALRREVLILIDPCENPDGRERFLAQTTAFAHAAPNPDTEDLSHTTVWPWGRGNHYLFDLNRDWFTLVQPESRRSEVIASWNPQLMVDSHEMGADDTYLFPPPRRPFNPHLPDFHREWWQRFAADQARALDELGYAYYTREWHEEFFPGYGSSWASYLGAVGILYEMSSTEGTLVRQRPGTLRTYAEAVEHQVASSVANLETLRANREALMSAFVAARRETIREGREGPVGAWIFPPGDRPDRADMLAALLQRQGVEVLRAVDSVQAQGLHDARSGRVAERQLPAGTWMVPLDQPNARLARVLIDPHVPVEPEFLREEREYLERDKGTRLYDTTAWSLPLLFGVEAWWSAAKPRGTWRLEKPAEPKGALDAPAGERVYGYLLDGGTDRSTGALADLLQRGLAVRVAEKAFRVNGRSYGRGTVLLKREGNPGDLADRLVEVAERWGIDVRATSTALAEDGPDLGGRHFRPLVAPRVGVWTGSPVSPSHYGAVWHLLDRQLALRFSGLDLARFARTDLVRYNVLVFPPVTGGAKAYAHALGEKGLARLRSWVEAGGTAVGVGSGAEFLADAEMELTRARPRRQALERFPPVVLGLGPEAAERAGPLRAAGIRAVEPAPVEEEGRGAARPPRKASELEVPSPYDVPPVIGPGAVPFAGESADAAGLPEPVDLATWLERFLPPGKREPDPEDLERADERLRRFVPRGALLRVELDPEAWLGWGLPEEIAVWLGPSDALVAEPPVRVAARFASLERLHLGGLLWPEAAGRIAHTAYATREAVGRGQVILFAVNPAWRGWALDPQRMLANAIVYGPGLGTRWSTPW